MNGFRISRGIGAALFGTACVLSASLWSLPAQNVQESAMHRMYNPNSGEHFYTASSNEKDTLISLGWNYEGTGWIAPAEGTPVFRLYDRKAGDHHYTMDETERSTLISQGWKDEGIGWYSDPSKSVTVWRQFNPNGRTSSHNYTTSRDEADYLISLGWKDEGPGWYALREGTPAPARPAQNDLGPLHVEGTRLLKADGTPAVLQGFSTFGLNYMPEFVDLDVFKFLKEQMNSDIVRLALYTQEYGGYCSGGSQQQLKALIDKGVEYARQSGQYVIIDWHILSDGNPNLHADEAAAFFDEISARYAGQSHVLYEICNEPNGCDWAQIKAYANRIIPIIRAHDPDAVILVGTPTWSQDVDTAARSPLEGFSNLMYSLHFYAATHKEGIRSKLTEAHQQGLPVFVSEFGISSADGNGTLDPQSGDAWISLLDQYQISRVGWALSNKDEASALFLPSTRLPLGLKDLSSSGRWFYQTYTQRAFDPALQPSLPSDPAADQSAQSQSPSVSSENLSARLNTASSWASGSKTMTQYTIDLSVDQGSLSGWTLALEFPGSVRLDQSWNLNASLQGNTLILRPADYNQTVSAGSPVSIGLIVETDSRQKPVLTIR